ncbi:MAG: MBOAT family O-acyltransferase [Planctomycetota bacterium]
MSFDTVTFALFFALAFAVWRFAPFGAAKGVALVGSLVFYAWWSVWYLPLILASAGIDYYVGARIHRAAGQAAKRRWLFVSLATNLGLLGTFKYATFFLENTSALLARLGFGELSASFSSTVPWVVPVGISFYTFQTLSYSLDIYRGRLAPAASFRDFALFVAFFPQLVAGPIVRAQELLPQLERRQRPSPWRVQHGLYLVLWGLFAKMVVADNLAPEVERIFRLGAAGAIPPATMWLGLVYSGCQVFADFAGYSAIAIGLASLMGLRFPANFVYPYLSRSPSEFWVRWHVTLSTWIRDYIYLPLGGNRKGEARAYLNSLITMTLAGLWHGAAWTYVLWGAYHGVGVAVERFARRVTRAKRDRRWPREAPSGAASLAWRIAGIVLCNVFIHTSWTFFRAPDLAATGRMLRLLYIAPFEQGLGLAEAFAQPRYLLVALPVFLMHLARALREWTGWSERPWHRAVAAAAMLLLLLVVRRGDVQDFVYFQF